jgi:DNA-binding response OmpR family regulator
MGVSARVGNKDLPTTFEQFKSRIEDMKADEAIETLLFAIEGLLKDERAPLPFDAGEGAFSPKQRALLGFLHRHKGVVTKERIMSALYLGEDDPPHSDIVAVLVCHVRKKLPDHIDIANVHGVGYELRVAEVAK